MIHSHPTDGNTYAIERHLAEQERDEVGTEVGDLCNRYPEPDEDAPRGYRPKPCIGTMFPDAGRVSCDTCWEVA